MDKNTLVHYGLLITVLIVIFAVLLSITPYGDFIKDSLYKNTKKLFNQAEVDAVYPVTIEDSVYGVTTLDSDSYKEGSEVTLYCTPYTGFLYNGAQISTASGESFKIDKNQTSFTMPSDFTTIRVLYTQIGAETP